MANLTSAPGMPGPPANLYSPAQYGAVLVIQLLVSIILEHLRIEFKLFPMSWFGSTGQSTYASAYSVSLAKELPTIYTI